MKLGFTLLVGISSLVHAQEWSAVAYFDKDWQPAKDSLQAVYYRTVEPQQGKVLVKDFYRATRSLQMEALCSSISPKLVQDGLATFYYQNGTVQRTGMYSNGIQVGLHHSFYENGTPRSIKIYGDKEERIAQFWSPVGVPLLEQGTGLFVDAENLQPIHVQVRDSVQLFRYVVEAANDTIYLYTQTPVEYRGGMEAFYRGLSKSINYPMQARRKGVEGTVFVQFTVNKSGEPTDASVLKGIGAGCNEAAVEACLKQKNWQPGMLDGKPIKMRMVLPVIFRLN
jgi:periplasmic protein TonB